MRGISISNIGFAAALASLGPLDLSMPFAGGPNPRGSKRRKTTSFAHGLNGPRAVARRLRQIERGSLREANGLVRS